MARPSRSVVKVGSGGVDHSDVDRFQRKLEATAALADAMAEDFQQDWGQEWASEIIARTPTGPGIPVHLKDEIRQVEPGGITMGRAFWWRFLERGTVNMAPQPFINPAMKKIRTPARKDAAQRAIDLIQSGKVKGAAR